MHRVDTDEQGRFRIAGLPPYERYLAIAPDYLEDGEHTDPEFLERIRVRATTVEIGDGEHKIMNLKLQ